MKNQKIILYVVLPFLLMSCGGKEAELLTLQTSESSIDLVDHIPGDWDRVCVLLPYSTFSQAFDTLGVVYFPELYSSIGVMDDRTLLVTIRAEAIVGAYEVLRENVDFTQVEGGCYTRASAVFRYQPMDDGWHKLMRLAD